MCIAKTLGLNILILEVPNKILRYHLLLGSSNRPFDCWGFFLSKDYKVVNCLCITVLINIFISSKSFVSSYDVIILVM